LSLPNFYSVFSSFFHGKVSNNKCNGKSAHSSSGEGRAPRGLSKPPVERTRSQRNFHAPILLQHKKGDRSLLEIKYFCVVKKEYKHLTPEQRYTIDVLLQQKKSRIEICETIKISQSTLCRELKRNSGQRGYHCKQAQVRADDRKRRLQNYRNLTIELHKFIRGKITKGQWSPAQIVGHLRRKGEKCVCVETIYAYIRADKVAGGDLWKHCRHQLKHRKRQVSAQYVAVQNRETSNKEFNNLQDIKNDFPKYVDITGPLKKYPGINHIHLTDFLKMEF